MTFYNQRGTAEQWIKQGKSAVKWTRQSCRSMQANAVWLPRATGETKNDKFAILMPAQSSSLFSKRTGSAVHMGNVNSVRTNMTKGLTALKTVTNNLWLKKVAIAFGSIAAINFLSGVIAPDIIEYPFNRTHWALPMSLACLGETGGLRRNLEARGRLVGCSQANAVSLKSGSDVRTLR